MNRRHALIGLVSLVLTALFGVYVISGLSGRTGGPFQITVNFARVGQLLRVTGDVKARGVLVGKIHKIEHLSDGTARLTLTIDPVHKIPADVFASVRGKTLFGEKFVELIDPKELSGRLMKPGDEIPLSRTVAPFELEQVLESLQPFLDTIDPKKLGGAIKAVAQGLAGQEEEAGRAIDNAVILFEALGASRDDLDRLFSGVDEGTGALARSSPDFIASLDKLDVLARSLVANADNLSAVVRDAPEWLEVAAALVESRFRDLVDLSVKGADVLDVVASHRTELPFAVEGLKDFTQAWVTNLSAPCKNLAGVSVETQNPGSTCWQVWALTGEKTRDPGGYTGDDKPQPGNSVAAAAYRAQVRQLLRLPFGTPASGLALLLFGPVRDASGLIPEALL